MGFSFPAATFSSYPVCLRFQSIPIRYLAVLLPFHRFPEGQLYRGGFTA
jgi:hypothetical protein